MFIKLNYYFVYAVLGKTCKLQIHTLLYQASCHAHACGYALKQLYVICLLINVELFCDRCFQFVKSRVKISPRFAFESKCLSASLGKNTRCSANSVHAWMVEQKGAHYTPTPWCEYKLRTMSHQFVHWTVYTTSILPGQRIYIIIAMI